eukprot:3807933-Pyramimonas_sp.AAC.1
MVLAERWPPPRRHRPNDRRLEGLVQLRGLHKLAPYREKSLRQLVGQGQAGGAQGRSVQVEGWAVCPRGLGLRWGFRALMLLKLQCGPLRESQLGLEWERRRECPPQAPDARAQGPCR